MGFAGRFLVAGRTALLTIPGRVGAGTALAPSALARLGARWPGAGGLAAMGAGFALLAAGLPDTALWQLGIGLVVFGFGFGLAITPGTVWCSAASLPVVTTGNATRRAFALPVRSVRLEASAAVTEARLRRRYSEHQAPSLDWHLERHQDLARQLAVSDLDELVINTDDQVPRTVAELVLDHFELS